MFDWRLYFEERLTNSAYSVNASKTFDDLMNSTGASYFSKRCEAASRHAKS
ncbi:hypothetical protein PCAR4_540044 [Paraburkholderia caribensis]|nr:hypothetical protein PCAR4_540044 [Paraburkholderia caribensis]